MDREASQSTDEGSPGYSSLWSESFQSEQDSSVRSSSKCSRSARSSSSSASRYMDQLSERYFNGSVEDKRGVLREAQEAAAVVETCTSAFFVLLQHALKVDSDPALATDAVQHVASLVVSGGNGPLVKGLARDLLLACHEQHLSKEVRIQAIRCTGELLRSSSPENQKKALEALQKTLAKLMGKPDSQEEVTAVLETYKEATGEDMPLHDGKKRARDL